MILILGPEPLGPRAKEVSEQGHAALKTPIHHVDALDFVAAEEERETHVPVGLLARAEDGQGLDTVAAAEE